MQEFIEKGGIKGIVIGAIHCEILLYLCGFPPISSVRYILI